MNNFHKTKKSAAVLKHAILDQYATPFASKTGKTSLDHRVAFIDGYAGPGRYEDGEEGSGAMLLRKARDMAHFPRQVECHFVEDDEATVERLREVAAAEGAGVEYTIDDGDISTHLPKLLKSAEGIPLFTYLDPCGLPIPLDEVASIFDRPSGPGAPATEVLINLTAHLRRFGGMLHSATPVEASLRRIDAVCGGEWWRNAWLEKCPTKNASEDEKMAAEEAVVVGYAKQLRSRAGGAGTWIIDVRPRADLKPVYYLIFATRYIDGMVTFGDSASLGLEAWRKYLAKVAADGTLFGDDDAWEADWKEQEKILKTQWVDMLADRLSGELEKGETFCIIERPKVLGDLAGVVRTLHFRAAINKVLKEGKTTTDPKGAKDLWRLPLKPA
ncbi:three-Cys-motif partner protein TcmP [Nocardia sp. NPDC050793]|uniref:three-Cys-motif partner protein TcmP n=1 Tax=Nocardia sp. NPDC050793 TaxID=3155159 RepID=UPI0033D8F13F